MASLGEVTDYQLEYLEVNERVVLFNKKYVMLFGMAHNIDTSTWASGTYLWSKAVGDFDNLTEIPGADLVFIGIVVESDAILGSIFVHSRLW